MRDEVCSKCGRTINDQGVCLCNQAEVPDVESALENARSGYTPTPTYEYNSLVVDEYTGYEEIESKMDELGKRGWQMTGVIPRIGDRDCQLVFMRPI